MSERFTPLNATRRNRLEFDREDVKVLSGDIDRRGLGMKGIVEIAGARYEVYGLDCDLENCQCDAMIKPVD